MTGVSPANEIHTEKVRHNVFDDDVVNEKLRHKMATGKMFVTITTVKAAYSQSPLAILQVYYISILPSSI